MSDICLSCGENYKPNGIIFCDDCGMDKDIEQQLEREGEQVRECECKLEGNLFSMCDEHKRELATLKNNPPYWAIKARGGK